ncbi:MAG: hypothetical protein ABI240_16845 [Sphingomonas sp.]
MRKILGIIFGAVIALVIVAALSWVYGQFYPLSVDISIDLADQATRADVIANKTMLDKLLWVSPWLFASFGGAWFALRVSDWKWAGWIVSALILVIAVLGLFDLPEPFWMQACAVALPILGGWLAARIHHKPYPGEPLLG